MERCRNLNKGGLGVDERQTAMTLSGLRRQTPDAPLKNLAQPLPKPVGKQSAAPASGAPHGSGAAGAADDGAASPSGGGIDPRPQLSDELIAGAKEYELAFMGPDYADRRIIFFGEGVKDFTRAAIWRSWTSTGTSLRTRVSAGPGAGRRAGWKSGSEATAGFTASPGRTWRACWA